MPHVAARLRAPAWALLGLGVLAAGLAVEAASGLEMPEAAGDLAAGLALAAGGVAMWTARPDSRAGPLALLTAIAWFAGDLASGLLYVHRGPLVHLLLTYPSGRLRSKTAAAVIAAASITSVTTRVPGLFPPNSRASR